MIYEISKYDERFAKDYNKIFSKVTFIDLSAYVIDI